MDNNIAHTISYGERVTSSYAEIYLNDRCSKLKAGTTKIKTKNPLKRRIYKAKKNDRSEWTSPSDLLIDILGLSPPFTSKITRGKTHEGILAIGNDILEKERARFLKYVDNLINENDAAWNQILEQERAAVEKKVNSIYHNIFMKKSKIMTSETATFYEETLQELEHHLRSDLQKVLLSTRASIISDLNSQIKQKLDKEKSILEIVLQQRYENEINKVHRYYKLLLQHESYKNNQFINRAMIERNDALKAFCRQMETDNITSTMYVMCTERKKCKIKQFVLENYQNTVLTEKLEEIKAKKDILDAFGNNNTTLSEINRQWEEKITKILKLFIKFISFSLKLLPEQTTFLLDFQKMVVLQLNEIHKLPEKCPSILIHEDELQNIFKFENCQLEKSVCDSEPFVIVGDQSEIPQPLYGSRETIPSQVDLPIIKLQRQYVYAKCHNFEEIKELLEKKRCKCGDIGVEVPITTSFLKETPEEEIQEDVCVDCESSNELLLIDDVHRLHECPVRGCKDWIKSQSFPIIENYLDFTEENFERVKTLLDEPNKEEFTPELVNPKSIVYSDIVFGPTNEPFHTVETQYSSQEELSPINIECHCINISKSKLNICQEVEESTSKVSNKLFQKSDSVKMINKIIMKRQDSLKRLLLGNENLLKMFHDESFDFE